MKPLLAIDTATDWASVAVVNEDGVLAERSWLSHRRHTVELAIHVDEMLSGCGLTPGDLASIAVAIGPGSYTGLRVGLALAKGIAVAAGLSIVPVPTLDVLAAPWSPPYVPRTVPLWVAITAGRRRLLVAAYPPQPGDWPDPAGLISMPSAELPSLTQAPAWAVGEFDGETRRALQERGLQVLPPVAGMRRAGWLGVLALSRLAQGQTVAADEAVPVYPLPTEAPR